MAPSIPAWDGHHNFLPDSTKLVGRDKDVASLYQLVLGCEGRLVTPTGAGDCGKTRLALRVTGSMIGSFEDGVWLEFDPERFGA